MKFSHISIGAGITGFETIFSIVNEVLKKKSNQNKQISIAVIDKNPENIPGGVGYGFNISKYGFFNNPIRLSPKEFVKWLSQKKIKVKIINYLKLYGGYTGKIWIKKNKNFLFSNKKKYFNELYIPRALSNIWMEEKLFLLLKKIKKKKLKIKLKFFKGEVIQYRNINKNLKKLYFKNNICKELHCKISKNKFKKISFVEKDNIKSIYSKTLSIGLGLPPPKQLASQNAQRSNNYIWDFYAEGSTSILLNKISKFKKNKDIVVYFIGYKAGLLESLPELNQTIRKRRLKIKLLCSSKNLKSIEKAELSKNRKKYKLKILNKKNLGNIDTAKSLYDAILKEFEFCKTKNYDSYDAWTEILKQNILDKCIVKFKNSQKIIYSKFYHSKIRNQTRFTYPETINAREYLNKKKILITKKEQVKKVDVIRKRLVVKTSNGKNKFKNYLCDIVVNVSGPQSVKDIKNEVPIINFLKLNGAKLSSGSFLVDKNFSIKGIKNIYTTGILASNFNPERKTIFNAILKNSKVAGKSIAKLIT